MRLIIVIVYIFLFTGVFSGQEYDDKSYYLIDSLNIEELNSEDAELIELNLKDFHALKSDTARLERIARIVEECIDINVWPRYNDWLIQELEALLEKNNLSDEESTEFLYFQSTALNNKGYYQEFLGNTKLALELYEQSLAIDELISDTEGIAATTYNIAYILENEGKYNEALSLYLRSLQLFNELEDELSIADTYNNIGYLHKKMGNVETAEEYYQLSLEIRKRLNDLYGLSTSYNNLGGLADSQGDIQKALMYYQKCLELRQELDMEENISIVLSNIGLIYDIQGEWEIALEYYNQGIEIDNRLGNKSSLAALYNNIGGLYDDISRDSLAETYYNKALKLNTELENLIGMIMALDHLGRVNYEQGKLTEAIDYLKTSESIHIQVGINQEMSFTYSLLSQIYFDLNDFDKAYHYALESYEAGKLFGYPKDIYKPAEILSKLNKRKSNYKEALNYYEEFIINRDSVLNEQNQKFSLRQRFQNEYDKKVATDSIHNIELEKVRKAELWAEQAETEKQRQQKYYLYGGLILLIVFVFFMINRFNIIRKQKLLIHEQHREISDSINYAELIQNAALPEKSIVDVKSDSMLIFKPKDIVSGDFYWLEERDGRGYFVVADCTGHGIPGAFISLIGTILLNEIFNSKKLTLPNEILDELSRLIILTLTNKEGVTLKDGMDISFGVLDKKTNELFYSGANNPVWVISKSDEIGHDNGTLNPNISDSGLNLFQVKADKQPIGKYVSVPKPFSLHKLQLNEGDNFYLFTDGYADQFGGSKGKKFMYKPMKRLLLSLAEMSMENQKESLIETFETWKSDFEQVDDVCIIGVKV